MTADEAVDLTAKSIDEDKIGTLDNIFKLVREACLNRKWSISINFYDFNERLLPKLENLGFTVRLHGINDDEMYYLIEW